MPGQTVTQIRNLLAAAGARPKHAFGQNFLIDLNLMQRLVRTAEITPRSHILEIGPGTGSLTECLLHAGARVVAVEIDRSLAELLRTRLGGEAHFTLIEGDVLESKHRLNPVVVAALPDRFDLVANLPYDVATPLIIELLLLETKTVERLTFTIQREVADRLRATRGNDAYGPLAVVVDTLAEVRLIARLPPSVFWPAPKVESAMIQLVRRSPDRVEIKPEHRRGFAAFIQRAFQQRRKMLRRSARDWDVENPIDAIAAAGVSPDARPEEVAPADWRAIFRRLAARRR